MENTLIFTILLAIAVSALGSPVEKNYEEVEEQLTPEVQPRDMARNVCNNPVTGNGACSLQCVANGFRSGRCIGNVCQCFNFVAMEAVSEQLTPEVQPLDMARSVCNNPVTGNGACSLQCVANGFRSGRCIGNVCQCFNFVAMEAVSEQLTPEVQPLDMARNVCNNPVTGNGACSLQCVANGFRSGRCIGNVCQCFNFVAMEAVSEQLTPEVQPLDMARNVCNNPVTGNGACSLQCVANGFRSGRCIGNVCQCFNFVAMEAVSEQLTPEAQPLDMARNVCNNPVTGNGACSLQCVANGFRSGRCIGNVCQCFNFVAMKAVSEQLTPEVQPLDMARNVCNNPVTGNGACSLQCVANGFRSGRCIGNVCQCFNFVA